ncbi:MAG: TolC family protein [Flavobacteriales bacterium]|nr:TolC family protein [Flavobacteriales bacterium]
MKNIFLYFIIVLFLSITNVYAQQESTDTNTVNSTGVLFSLSDYKNIPIPTLDVLLKNASENPAVKYYSERVEESHQNLRWNNRKWTDHIKLNATYQYGQGLYTTVADGGVSIVDDSGKIENRWAVGATMALPLSEIFNRGPRSKMIKAQMRESEYQAQNAADNIRLQIIDAYTEVQRCMSLIKSVTEAKNLATGQYKVTEKEFVNGRVDAKALSQQKNIEAVAVREYELVKAQLNNALLKLEQLSKINIISHE